MQFEMMQGAIAGVVFGLGALLISIAPRYKWTLASILCVFITPLALLPFWFSYGDLGISDWDYYFSMHTNLRNAIVHYGQFPMWNPYTCGGTAALGDPEFPVLSPLFIPEIIFGVPAGLRLSIYLATAIGSLGMLHLSRKLGIGVIGALVAALPMSFGTVNLLESVEGHQNILAAMYIPWVFLCWYGAYHATKKARQLYLLGTAVLLALMFFRGGIYLLMYMAGAFIFLIAVAPRRKIALSTTLIAGMFALGFGAIKIVPVLLWLGQFQDAMYANSTFTLTSMHKILLGRILYGPENIIPNQGSGWHEYGAYVGWGVLLMAGVGSFLGRKRKLIKVLIIGGLIAMLISSMGPVLKPIFDALPIIPRSNISRLILFTVIPLSLLAGFGVHAVAKRSRGGKALGIILVLLCAVDIMSLAYALSAQAFVLPHVVNNIPQAPYPIAYSTLDYKIRHEGVDYTRAYDATLKGYGSLTYCAVLGPNPAVRLITDEGGKEMLGFPENTKIPYSILSWTPNHSIYALDVTEKVPVTLNANYAKGWYVNGVPAKEFGNKPGLELVPGTKTVEFSYISPGLSTGSAITVLTITVAIVFGMQREKPKRV
jgi:hypothetical protein